MLCAITTVVVAQLTPHPVITVRFRQAVGAFDQWSPRADTREFVMKRKVPDVQ